MSAVTPTEGRFALSKLVIAVHDLAGYTRAARETDDLALALFLDDYYALVANEIGERSGRIVKFIGDAMLAVFPEEACCEAIDAMIAVRAGVPAIARAHSVPVQQGNSNIHLATVAVGEFGPAADRRFDIIGAGVNHTFLLGTRQGAGIHISEPVFRQLPNERRAAWRKEKPPAVYTASG